MGISTLCFRPLTGRGQKYRGRYIAPLEKHMHHQAGYGRPFPPKYKEFWQIEGQLRVNLGSRENVWTTWT